MTAPHAIPIGATHLAALTAQTTMLRRIISLHDENERLKRRAGELGIEVPAVPVTMRLIATEVAEEHGLTLSALKARTPRYAIAHPRQEAMWRMRQERFRDGRHRWSLPQIGAFFGMDHTTALHGVRAVEKRLLPTTPPPSGDGP